MISFECCPVNFESRHPGDFLTVPYNVLVLSKYGHSKFLQFGPFWFRLGLISLSFSLLPFPWSLNAALANEIAVIVVIYGLVFWYPTW